MLRSMVEGVPSTSTMPRYFESIKENESDKANWDRESNTSMTELDYDTSREVEVQSPHGIQSPLSTSSNASSYDTSESSSASSELSSTASLYSHGDVEPSLGWKESPLVTTRWKDRERVDTSDDENESRSNYSSDGSATPLDRTRVSSSNVPLERTRVDRQTSMSYKPLDDTSISHIDNNLPPRLHDISGIDVHLPPTNIGHITIESLRHNDIVNKMQQNNSSLRNDMYQDNFNNRKNTKISMENLNDFPLASELYKNKRITMSQASNKEYMEQIENELRETK